MSVSEGITLDLSALPRRQRRALIKLISRISEASYRRGFQQGAYLRGRGQTTEDAADRLRHHPNLDRSPRGEDGRDSGRSALDLLSQEYGVDLRDVGLTIEAPPAPGAEEDRP